MERYVLQKSQTKPNSWVCTDTEHGIVCVFEDNAAVLLFGRCKA